MPEDFDAFVGEGAGEGCQPGVRVPGAEPELGSGRGVTLVRCVTVGVHDRVESLRDLVELPGVDLVGLVDEQLFHLVGGVLINGAGPAVEGFGDDGDVALPDVAVVQGGADNREERGDFAAADRFPLPGQFRGSDAVGGVAGVDPQHVS